MVFTYIIESKKNGGWYYGHSSDLDRRLHEHNSGQNRYTKEKGPWILIFARGYNDKSGASNFEQYLKKTRNKRYIKVKYRSYFIDDYLGM